MDAIKTRGHVDDKGQLVLDEPIDAQPGEYEIILLREDAEKGKPRPAKLVFHTLEGELTDPANTFRRVNIYDDEE